MWRGDLRDHWSSQTRANKHGELFSGRKSKREIGNPIIFYIHININVLKFHIQKSSLWREDWEFSNGSLPAGFGEEFLNG